MKYHEISCMRVRCTGVYVYIYIYIVYCATPGFCPGETWVDIPFIYINNKLGFDTVYSIYDIRCVLCVNQTGIYVTLKTSLCQAMAVLMMGATCQAHPSKMNG